MDTVLSGEAYCLQVHTSPVPVCKDKHGTFCSRAQARNQDMLHIFSKPVLCVECLGHPDGISVFLHVAQRISSPEEVARLQVHPAGRTTSSTEIHCRSSRSSHPSFFPLVPTTLRRLP